MNKYCGQSQIMCNLHPTQELYLITQDMYQIKQQLNYYVELLD